MTVNRDRVTVDNPVRLRGEKIARERVAEMQLQRAKSGLPVANEDAVAATINFGADMFAMGYRAAFGSEP